MSENLRPSFDLAGGRMTDVFRTKTLVFVCMLSTVFMAHFSAPRFFLELRHNTLPRFNAMVATSFASAAVLQMCIAAAGFLTFGKACSGLVLNNYGPGDSLMGAARIAVAVAVALTYPIPFSGCRDGVMDLMGIKSLSSRGRDGDSNDGRASSIHLTVTVVLLGSVTAAACRVRDLGLVLSLGGATLGNALIYVFPALMFWGVVRNMERDNADGMTTARLRWLRAEARLAILYGVFGAVLGVVGGTAADRGRMGK